MTNAKVEKASAAVGSWAAGAIAMALLRTAVESGVFEQLEQPSTPEEIARALGLDPDRVLAFCQALSAHGIAVRTGAAYRIDEGFRALEADDQPLLLSEQVAANACLQTGISTSLGAGEGFGQVGADESLALARLAWGRPGSARAHEMWRAVDAAMPEVVDQWTNGGTYAEFGCGAGRDLLRVLAMYPQVRAVGHDVLPHLVEDCRRQAKALGVDDRVELVLGDVCDADIDGEYDSLMWSQMFFPPPTRSRALAAAKRALRPGGYLLLPIMPEVPAPEHTGDSAQTRAVLSARLAYARWHIQWEPQSAVCAEVERAGFGFVRAIPNPRTPYLLFRR